MLFAIFSFIFKIDSFPLSRYVYFFCFHLFFSSFFFLSRKSWKFRGIIIITNCITKRRRLFSRCSFVSSSEFVFIVSVFFFFLNFNNINNNQLMQWIKKAGQDYVQIDQFEMRSTLKLFLNILTSRVMWIESSSI